MVRTVLGVIKSAHCVSTVSNDIANRALFFTYSDVYA